MEKKLFLGIADSDRYASVVLGDPSGKIIATSVGGSVNHHHWGMEQARANLTRLIGETVGLDNLAYLGGACFTYKADHAVAGRQVADLVAGVLDGTQVTVEEFARSSILGMQDNRCRLFLAGGQLGFAIFKNTMEQPVQLRKEVLMWNPALHLKARLLEILQTGGSQYQEEYFRVKSEIKGGKCICTMTQTLDQLAKEGCELALALAFDLAHSLVQLVMSLSVHFSRFDPMIGLYGQVLLGSSTVRSRVRHMLGLLFPECRIVDAPFAPAKGAYLSSIRARRLDFEQEVISDVFT
ncbi:MAG: hypothetical protein GX251_10410 [Firmicutes bacterium]|nr:hypothetical protein [Bacillota bacterium]